uniref:Uncharacterized protein n=1 Tax=Oryza meridionalis TaxID=40149 RepID=A0A0E0EAN8_9ORYZ
MAPAQACPISERPAAAIFRRTANPVAAMELGSTKRPRTLAWRASPLARGKSNGFMDTKNPLSRVCTAVPRPGPNSGTTGTDVFFSDLLLDHRHGLLQPLASLRTLVVAYLKLP